MTKWSRSNVCAPFEYKSLPPRRLSPGYNQPSECKSLPPRRLSPGYNQLSSSNSVLSQHPHRMALWSTTLHSEPCLSTNCLLLHSKQTKVLYCYNKVKFLYVKQRTSEEQTGQFLYLKQSRDAAITISQSRRELRSSSGTSEMPPLKKKTDQL